MTRIGAIGPGGTPARRSARGGGFGLPAPPTEARGAAGAAAVSSASLLALQSVDPARRDSNAMARAAATLDELRGWQLDLLDGTADPARLARLQALADGPQATTDPALRAALADVALRARVEIARRRARPASLA